MTIQGIIECMAVTGALVVLLVVPFLFLSSVLAEKKGWPVVTLGAMVFGCSTQAVLGIVWSHTVRERPFLEVLLYAFFCIIAFFWARYLHRKSTDWKIVISAGQSFTFLPVILFIAFFIRSIHPLQTFALGQSDAYTHLHYLNNIVEQGFLVNVIYPSGYHWLLALPVLVFKIDPYVMARFSGAFFGTGLVLAIYVVLAEIAGKRAARWGSFCAACFPGMVLLMKTGVGSFANQFGLLLVPCMLFSYVNILQEKRSRIGIALFFAAGMGFAASVPMMLCHVIIIIGIERVLSLFYDRIDWWRQSLRIMFLCLPAVLLIGFHFSQASGGQRFATAKVLTSYEGRSEIVTEKIIQKVDGVVAGVTQFHNGIVRIVTDSPYFNLVIDFFLVKRVGFANIYINSIAILLFIMFFYCAGYGVYKKQKGILILGLWGGLTTIQATIGLFQFSSYQREGWSLLIAACCLTGIIAALFLKRWGKFFLVKACALVIVIFSLYFSVLHPPSHPAIQSSAESLVIQTARFINKSRGTVGECRELDAPLCDIYLLLSRSLPVTMVSRKFVGWYNQGEILPNLLPLAKNVETLLVTPQLKDNKLSFSRKKQYLVFVDKRNNTSSHDLISAFAMVSPNIVKRVLQQQKHLYRANSYILDYIGNLNTEEWLINEVVLSKSLTSYVVVPKRGQAVLE